MRFADMRAPERGLGLGCSFQSAYHLRILHHLRPVRFGGGLYPAHIALHETDTELPRRL